jgi:hypothetical protein
MLDGELVIGYIWWEAKGYWIVITETNEWPPDTETTTAWEVRNTGDEAAFFKVRFMGLESSGVLLNPGEAAWYYVYPTTPSPGNYSYPVEAVADGEVVDTLDIGVTTKGAGPCFIATAAYGTTMAQEIDILRKFRDEILLPNSLGAQFVSFYYKISPPIARFISRHDFLRTIVREGFVGPIGAILNKGTRK